MNLDCELCGRPICGQASKITIDGAELLVCIVCSRLAQTTLKKKVQEPSSTRISLLKKEKHPFPTQTRKQASKKQISDEWELVENYGRVIRKAREAMQLSQEELSQRIAEKASVIQKLESCKLIPNEALIRKLERALKVKITQPRVETNLTEKIGALPELTLGDVAVMQKKIRKVEVSENEGNNG
jgi:putative transcription factor